MNVRRPFQGWPAACRALWLCLLGLVLAGPPAHGAEPAAAQQLCQATFATDPDGPWSDVALPDNWRRRGVAMPQRGWYRMQFRLEAAPVRLWAVALHEVTRHHELRVNGHLVGGALPDAGSVWLTRHGATTVALPPSLLHPGENTLELAVEHATFGRVSCLTIGPEELVKPRQALVEHLTYTLPMVLNLAALLFGAFIAVSWLRARRGRHVVGLIGLAWSAVALRSIVQLTDASPLTGMTAAWASMLASIGAGSGICALALALDQRRAAGWRWLVLAATLAFAAASAWPDTFEWWWRHRLDGYFGALGAAGLALLLSARTAYRGEHPAHGTIHAALGATFLALLADIFVWRGWQGVAAPSLAPFVGPAAMATAALAMTHSTLRDLTKMRRETLDLEQRVAQRTEALAQANAAKSRFLAAASHDLRQPVVTIGLLVDLLREQATEPRQRNMIDRVDEAVASMETFLGGLLDLSRFEAGAVTPKRRAVSLQALFDSVAGDALPAARMKGLRLRLRPSPLAVDTDPVLVQQMLRNLVSNALRYTDRGGVLVAARRRGGNVLLQVWDTGIGIPLRDQEMVFEELVQLANPGRDRNQGFGLGLAIVQRAAALLGHRLSLRSQPGRGSCFSIEMPIAALPPPKPLARPTSPTPLANQRVLLLDDDPSVLAALGDRLAHWGARVEKHGSLASLQQAYGPSAAAPDLQGCLLVTDMRLSDGRGMQAIELMRRHRADLPAIVITGNTQPEELAALHASGVPVLHKPFRAEALLQAILEAVPPGREAAP